MERKTDKKQVSQIEEANEFLADDISENNDEIESTAVVLIHDSPSPDSGHNTSSSPAESTSQKSHSPNEHLEFSESDLESCDRTERIRSKTEMTTSRIPSMCMITPPQSDDEVNLHINQVPYGLKYVPYETVIRNDAIKNNHNALNGKIPQSNGKLLHIQIPKVPDFKKNVTDIYAYPDKTKKIKSSTVKTVSTNGMLETNIDYVDESKEALHLIVNGETGYATIKNEVKKAYRSPSPSGGVMIVKGEKGKEEIPKPVQPLLKQSLLPSNFMERFKGVMSKQKKPEKKSHEGDYVMIVDLQKSPKTDQKHSRKEENRAEYVSLNELPSAKNSESTLTPSNENSLERKKRLGARVTLDSEGKVVYSSDSLKRKQQHSTFVPGKYVRESPTPSPLLDKRGPKPIRPVNCSGLIRTNSEDRRLENRTMSPQMGKLIIKAGSRACDSPTKDFVRMPPTRVVTPTNTLKRSDKGARVIMENGLSKTRSISPSSSETSSLERRKRIDRCISPSSSSSSSNETKKPELDVNAEEGKILNESELDKLGENFESDFSKQLEQIKLNISHDDSLRPFYQADQIPDIFRIEPEVPKRPVKRSNSYRMANCSLSLATDYTTRTLTTVSENQVNDSTKAMCEISFEEHNFKLLTWGDDKNLTGKQNLRIHPSVFNASPRSPYKVTKPADTEIARVLLKCTNDTEIW